MLTREQVRRMPKAELHVHLDGSLRAETMIDLARTGGVELPTADPAALRRYMLVSDARNLEDYLARFELTIALLQTPDAVERVAYEMLEDAAADNLRYLEIRYAPRLSTRHGLSEDDVIAAQVRGIRRGERDFGVRAGLICCALRQWEPALSLEAAEAAVRWRGKGVVGFDLAGPEAGNPASLHRAAFDRAAEGLLGITVHAGEAAGAESIADALHHCHADRIGHGTRLYEDPDLEAYVRDRRITVEINLTSNLQTRAVATAAEHPVRRYYDAGVPVTLNTDSWLMSGVSVTDEYWLAHTELRFTRGEIAEMILNGVAGAFLPWPERRALMDSVSAELAGLE
jgi:adenosine deaminase